MHQTRTEGAARFLRLPVAFAGAMTWVRGSRCLNRVVLSPSWNIWRQLPARLPSPGSSEGTGKLVFDNGLATHANLAELDRLGIRFLTLRHGNLKGKGRGPGVDKDIARICEIWRDCRARWGEDGEFLFGAFGAADAMCTPVVTRLDTYGVDLDGTCADCSRPVLSLPAFVEWREAALQGPWIVVEDEID